MRGHWTKLCLPWPTTCCFANAGSGLLRTTYPSAVALIAATEREVVSQKHTEYPLSAKRQWRGGIR